MMAIVIGVIGFAIIFLLALFFKGFNLFLYILMIVFLVGYAIFLKYLIKKKEVVVQKPVKKVLKPVFVVRRKRIVRPFIRKRILSAKRKVGIIDIALDDYIKYNLYYGRKKKDIVKKLVDSGWNKKNVELAFKKIGEVKPIMVREKGLSSEEKLIKENIKKSVKEHSGLRRGSKVILDKKVFRKLKKYEGRASK